MIKNIVFDWSGTISDDFEVVFHTLRAIFHDLGVAPLAFSHFQEVVDIPFTSFVQRLFSDSPDVLRRFSDARLT
ncbi:MAG TPA: hypothetical protein VI934_05035, partial [Candidatus Nanoarchaeia archaeon]|nr:hypothetical protein [Candidatus Nanoarchaeia archaeon]